MTRAIALVLIAVAFGIPAEAGHTPDSDEKDVVGSWVIQSVQDNGKEDTPFKGARLMFEGGRIEMQFADGDKAKGTYTLDSSKTPKAMDFGIVVADTLITRNAIYALENDTLTICLPASHSGARPEKLDGSTGSKCWLWKLKKAK
jgi:uncharacterized protein (TIGR03067 family)